MRTRREVLERAALLLGGAVSSPLVAALAGCARAPALAQQGEAAFRSLDARQAAFVGAIAEAIIPETDTPGATAARVDRFIDRMLTDWYPPADRAFFLRGLQELERRCLDTCGTPFAGLDAQQRLAFVDRLDAEAVQIRRAGVTPLPVFAMIKELVVVGYYTSTVGMSAELGTTGPVGVADFGAAGPPSGGFRY